MHKSSDEQQLAPTSRVQAALKKLFKSKGINPDALDAIPLPPPKKNPICLPPIQPQVEDDFYDETLDEEVARLMEEKKKAQEAKLISEKAATSSRGGKRSLKPKVSTVPAKKSRATKTKVAPATLHPSELRLSDESSDDD